MARKKSAFEKMSFVDDSINLIGDMEERVSAVIEQDEQEAKGKKVGRPKKILTDKEWLIVKRLMAIHCTKVEILLALGISEYTLDREIREKFREKETYSSLYDKFSSGGKISLRRKLFERAIEGDSDQMLKFALINYLGMSDKMEVENHIDVKGNAEIIANAILGSMDDEDDELEEFEDEE